ncbi:coiled-coil domain-containing protein 170-like isoform X2 [Lethenteron reissneri]|uniref:coiled-coil domain-containing protein 170-like isoform X2 n=1 Tax=Lethenteron reissneri TaxID=7753 RepID=UPI002AB60161|nr:coiled-coil domain-containing protein 170-like isoform X2 [Lethenteron reissneri]
MSNTYRTSERSEASQAAAAGRAGGGSRRIDANSNHDLLLSSGYRSPGHSRPASPGLRRSVSEMQEQLKMYKRQMEKKDEMIATLSAGRSSSSGAKVTFEPLLEAAAAPSRELLSGSHYRTAAETARSELAAMQVKQEGLEAELRELRGRLAAKESATQELRAELESHRENGARHASLIQSLRERLRDTEEASGALSSARARYDASMQAAQEDARDMQARIAELEERLRLHLAEREQAEQRAVAMDKRLEDAVDKLSRGLNVDARAEEYPIDLLASRATELFQECVLQRAKIASFEGALASQEVEAKASRETIMRLVSEVGREQKVASSQGQEAEALRKERESALQARRSLEREVEVLRERLEAGQRAWDAARRELAQWEHRRAELDGGLRSSEHEARAAHAALHAFRSQLAAILSDGDDGGGRDRRPAAGAGGGGGGEEDVKERVRQLVVAQQQGKAVSSAPGRWRPALTPAGEMNRELTAELEERVSRLTAQLHREAEQSRDGARRVRRAEERAQEMAERLRAVEGELATGDVLRDGLSFDRQKYMRFLEDLGRRLKVEELGVDVGLDLQLEAMLARADHLAKLECDSTADGKTLLYSLQRKVKAQKEKLQSKELHLEMLRKKVSQLEEERGTRTALAVERDDANAALHKLHRRSERLQQQLDAARTANTELKAQLADAHGLKIQTLEQNKTIAEMGRSIDRLEKVKDKASRKVASLRGQLDMTAEGAQEEMERTRVLLEATTGELRTVKRALEEVARREKQLLDFREVVGRTLGLDVASLAVPDYEVVARLERLVRAQHASVATAAALDGSLERLHGGFRAGYRGQRHEPRARSVSPVRAYGSVDADRF